MATVQLACNDCATERQGQVGQTIGEVRKKLAEVGWYIDQSRDLDLCPHCIGLREQRLAQRRS